MGTSEGFSSKLEHQLVLKLFRSCLGNHIVEMSWKRPFYHTEDTDSRRAPGPLPLMTFSPLLPWCSLRLMCWTGLLAVSTEAGLPSVSSFLHVDQFPLFSKKKKFHLICFLWQREWLRSLSRLFLNCLLKKKIQFKEEKQKAHGGEEIKGKKISQWRRKLWSCHYIHSELPIWNWEDRLILGFLYHNVTNVIKYPSPKIRVNMRKKNNMVTKLYTVLLLFL